MNLHHGLSGLTKLPAGAIVSIGNFDGLHRGHQSLLDRARQLRGQSPGARLVVVTFEPHPLTVLRPDKAPPRLTPPVMKRALLSEQGVDDLVELPPDESVLNLTAEQFWAILRDQVRPSHLVEGPEFTFGKGRGGNIARLRDWAAQATIALHVVAPVEAPLLDLHVVPVSSTLVRWLIAHGRVRDAAICLGRPYALRGEVIKGHQRGRTIGIPTANLKCDQLLPGDGVYAGRCTLNGRRYAAALSIGTLPTFGDSARQVEAYLLDFSGDLYGQTLTVEVLDWLREQWKFKGLDELKDQIARDVTETRNRSKIDASRAVGVA